MWSFIRYTKQIKMNVQFKKKNKIFYSTNGVQFLYTTHPYM